VTASDRDLVAALRAELAAVDQSRPCDRRAEAQGLGPMLATREPSIARLAVRLGAHAEESRSGSVLRRFRIGEGSLAWEQAPEHCRVAWLRGRFLAHGSLSLSGGRMHLEFTVPVDEAPVLSERLAGVGLPASWRIRRRRGVVTWKGAEHVVGFLGLLGASAALLEIEARSVARALRGELNRVLNAESANLHRSVAAAGRQLAAIDTLDEDGRLTRQPRTVREVAVARRETPEASLSEIAVRLGIHRSAVQRALDRMERLALHDDDGVGRRRRGPHGGDAGESRGRVGRGRLAAVEGPTGRSERAAPLA
jgi:hypothetical protein